MPHKRRRQYLTLLCEQIPDAPGRAFMRKLYHDYGRLMYRIANKCCSDRFAQEDIVQVTLLKLMEKNALLQTLEEKALVAYVSVSVRNTAYSYLRKQAKEQEIFVPLEEGVQSLNTASVEETMDLWETKGILAKIWRTLSAEERFLLEGRYILQYTDRELSEGLDCKPGSVRMKLTRVRRKVLKALREQERKGDGKP